jgi:predicted secreted protein
MNVSAMAAEGEQVLHQTRAISLAGSEESKLFTIDHDGGNIFSIMVSENISTGYMWSYTMSDEGLVSYEGDTVTTTNEELVGAPSEKKFTFQALEKGVSTIKFEEKRSFEESPISEFTILVYKTDETVIVEEDSLMYTMDNNVNPELYTIADTVTYKGEEIVADVDVQVVNGVTMIPLRATLEAMGYTVSWNGQTKSVDISKGAQWTSVSIGENAYFRNKMAAHELSAAPIIIKDRTLVPAEFFADILNIATDIDNKELNFTDNESVIHSGFIKSITYDETGTKTLTLTEDLSSDLLEIQIIIHTSDAYSFYQKEVQEGDFVSVVASMIMTMSMPGQTTGYIIY